MGQFALALDFGGTKLASAVVETDSGKILGYQKINTPAEQGAQVCLETMCNIGEKSILHSGINADELTGAGISFGGPVSADGQTVIKSEHIQGWDNFPLAQTISDYFKKPARMANDGNAAALGEWVYGSHKCPDFFAYMQISTGIGGGLVLNRELFSGQGLAPEMGHMKVPVFRGEAKICACGGVGCMESIASGWALAREAKTLYTEGNKVIHRKIREGAELSAKTLIEAAHEEDAAAITVVQAAFTSVAAGVANMILLFDLQEFVIGGSVAVNSWDILLPVLNKNESMLTTPMRGRCSLRVSQLKGMETLLGAAALL